MSKTTKTILIIVGVLVLLVLLVGGKLIRGYNNVIAMDENVKGKWAQVENQLKRRYDLIPNLVETVKGYASHEKELFENIAQARTEYFQARSLKDKVAGPTGLKGLSQGFSCCRKGTPNLKPTSHFLSSRTAWKGPKTGLRLREKDITMPSRY